MEDAEDRSSWLEVILGVYVIFPCVLISTHILELIRPKGDAPLWLQYVVELLLLVLPSVAAFTVLNSHLLSFSLLLTITALFLSTNKPNVTHKKRVPSSQNTTVTLVRAAVAINTAIAILAVDFKCFPARFMKTETYGYSLMDVGASSFLLINALVDMRTTKNYSTVRWLQSVLVLLVLGVLRLLSLKATNYHQNPSEYGKHSNFFFVLAITKLGCLPIAWFVPVSANLFLALLLSFIQLYGGQYGAEWVFQQTDREDLLDANKETVVAMAGHFALYFFGAWLGKMILSNKRPSLTSWLHYVGFVVSGLALVVTSSLGTQPSRRLVNAEFIIWMVFVLFFCFIVCSFLEKNFNDVKIEVPLIMQAVNKHQLLFFLVSNVLTGLINLSVDTDSITHPYDTLCVCTYTALITSAVTLLYVRQKKISDKQ